MEPPNRKQLEFMVVMLWVALLASVVILVIDFQIKSAILKESERAWRYISAIGPGQRGTNSTGNPAGNIAGSVPGGDDPRVEVETVPVDPAEATGQSANGHKRPNPRPAARARRVPPADKQAPE
jgi:hypothetical protein